MYLGSANMGFYLSFVTERLYGFYMCFTISLIVVGVSPAWSLPSFVNQLVCLTVGNSHSLKNNYPYDLKIIQLISFISYVIMHNRLHFPPNAIKDIRFTQESATAFGCLVSAFLETHFFNLLPLFEKISEMVVRPPLCLQKCPVDTKTTQ